MEKSTGQAGWEPGDGLEMLEARMLHAAAAGELLGPGDDAAHQGSIRAAVLCHLLADTEWPVDAKGVRLRGVRIDGQLDLESAVLRCPLHLEHCSFDGSELVNLNYASVSRLALIDCTLPGLSANALSVTSNLDLSRSTLTGPLLLQGASVAGNLDCSGARLQGRPALRGESIKIGGNICLVKAVAPADGIDLRGADIGGALECTGAELNGALTAPDGSRCSLFAEWMKVGGPVRLDKEFSAAYTVWLLGACITANLNCRRAVLKGKDVALLGELMKVEGNILAEKMSATAGSVAINLVGADIAGNLKCPDAELTGGEWGLWADRLTVGGDVFLESTSFPRGGMGMPGAHISGNLDLTGTRLCSLVFVLRAERLKVGGDVLLEGTAIGVGEMQLAGADITGTLRWAPAEQVCGVVNLTDAKAGHLSENFAQADGYWPAEGRLCLAGFTYGSILTDRAVTVGDRLKWVRSQWLGGEPDRQATFSTQPYEQLASIYQQAGQDSEARAVAVARRHDTRRYGNLAWYRKVLNWLLEWSIQYGYQTWRAVLLLVFLYIVAVAVFWGAQHHGNLIVPLMQTAAGHRPPPANTCTMSYPCFYPAGYAIDSVIPIINVHQATYWGPNGQASWGYALTVFTWLCTAFGWTLATLTVAGYTGLARNSDQL